MNEFEASLLKYIDINKLRKIQSIKVGIAGAGGLGSNCALNLVRCGFKKFRIVDFDIVEYSNLNRQFFFLDQVGMPKVEALRQNLSHINPDIQIEALNVKVTKENVQTLFYDCDVIVEAFDRVECKTMIVEEYFSSGKFLVAASGIGGWGNSDDIIVKKVHSRFCLIGDQISEVNEDMPPLSPKVNITAAKQADVVLEWAIER